MTNRTGLKTRAHWKRAAGRDVTQTNASDTGRRTSSAATSLYGTYSKPGTRGPKPAWYFGWPAQHGMRRA
eukprot:5008656-Pleurochrysis_carterae.AAC.1